MEAWSRDSLSLITQDNKEYIKSVTFIVCKYQAFVTSRHVLHAVSKMFKSQRKCNKQNINCFWCWTWNLFPCERAVRWRNGLERSPHKRKVVWSNLSRDRPKYYKQVVTAPQLNARPWVLVSRVLGYDHYKRMPRVTVGVVR